ncbi:hypothetical protein [Halobacillus sp. BBL2006]|uniref:hypothetical protein n=1 Tax=Halobacillus sp. BBL2006 TaxID=1543706 RepID=UPI0005442310|nr:hypothetical protein [Halobacillus sp. BBL2006]KHE72931.1 hypothetical protein LD39_01975 [Halobacillus sp. BBL2006]
MPKSIPGKISALILAVFCIQVIVFFVTIFNQNGFGAMVNFIQLAPYTALLGLIFGIAGTIKEEGIQRLLTLTTLGISVVFLCFTIYFLFIWSFGG